MDGKAPIETLRGPDTALTPIYSDRVASAISSALGGSGSNSPAHHVLHTSSSGPDVTWASTNNLQDLVMPPSDAPAFSKAKAKDPLFGSQATMNDSDTDGDNNTNRPGTEEFHKFSERQLTAEVIFCASMGNLKRMKTILKRANKDISRETFADYDLRTPLHVAASDV